MTPADLDRLEELYAELSSLAPAARTPRLNLLAAQEPALTTHLSKLLGAQILDLDEQIRTLAAAGEAQSLAAESIGPYRLLGTIGEGGFGIVYLAEQTTPVHRLVALKIIKPGMDTKSVLARFRHELHALSALNHPAIPAVLDAGETPDHRPYVVMPVVPGQPITTFCRDQNLPLAQMLTLMRDICHAVQHAHSRGVLHRDLKPDNILVSIAEGALRPAIIDFGLAKALASPTTHHTALTIDGQLLGTPEYMAPEQAQASPDVDIRSDIYSLGCILYELIAARPPFTAEELRAKGRTGLLTILTEQQPLPPSQHRERTWPRDLDWIILRCLEKDPARRYPTADALAQELDRLIRGQNIEAGPPARLYRLWRWTVRRRLVVSAAALGVVSLVAGTTVSLVYAAQARQSLADARQVSQLTREILTSVDPRTAQGLDPELLLMMLDRSESVFKDPTLSPRVELELHETFALAYRAIGDFPKVSPHARRAEAMIIADEGRDSPRRLLMLHCIADSNKHDPTPRQDRPTPDQIRDEFLRVATINNTTANLALIDAQLTVYRTSGLEKEKYLPMLAECERLAGPNSERTIEFFRVVGRLAADRREPEAVGFFTEARRRAIETFGPDHPAVHSGISRELFAIGISPPETMRMTPAAAAAVIKFAKAHLAAAERALGWRHRDISTAIFNYASALASANRFDAAVTHFNKAIDFETRARGDASPLIVWIKGDLAAWALLFKRQSLFDELEPQLWMRMAPEVEVDGPAQEVIIRHFHAKGDMINRDRWFRHFLAPDHPTDRIKLARELGFTP